MHNPNGSYARKAYAQRQPISDDDYSDEQIAHLRNLAQINVDAHLADVAKYNRILSDRETARRAAESDGAK